MDRTVERETTVTAYPESSSRDLALIIQGIPWLGSLAKVWVCRVSSEGQRAVTLP